MSRKKRTNFLKDSYDKVIMAAVFVALIFSLVLLIGKSSASRRDGEAYKRELESLRPVNPTAETISDELFRKTVADLETPSVFDVSENSAGLLIAEERIACVKCGYPIFFDADICPACNEKQPADEVGADWDSDGDGMPDKYEDANGFNPADPSDAEMDADEDGFSNIEEYQAGTDPKNAAAHPPRVKYLRVAEVKAKRFPFVLKGKMKDSKGYRYQINHISTGDTWFIRENREVSNSGYKIVKSEKKTKLEKKPGIGSGEKKVEVIVLTLSNGIRSVKIVEGEKPVWNEQEVTFICEKDPPDIKYVAKELETFVFDGAHYMVKSVDKDNGSVVVEDEKTHKEITVPKR